MLYSAESIFSLTSYLKKSARDVGFYQCSKDSDSSYGRPGIL